MAQSGTPLTVNFTNNLPPTYSDWLPVDTRLTPLGRDVRLMTHLHGGFVAADSDGNPAVSPLGFGQGDTQRVFYANQARSSPACRRGADLPNDLTQVHVCREVGARARGPDD